MMVKAEGLQTYLSSKEKGLPKHGVKLAIVAGQLNMKNWKLSFLRKFNLHSTTGWEGTDLH